MAKPGATTSETVASLILQPEAMCVCLYIYIHIYMYIYIYIYVYIHLPQAPTQFLCGYLGPQEFTTQILGALETEEPKRSM